MADQPQEGSWKSRKLWMTVLTQIMLTGVFLHCCDPATVAALFPIYATTMLGALGVMVGGNSAIRYINSKAGKTEPKPPKAS